MPIGPLEIAVLAFFILLFFGARRLPEMGRSLGVSMREFKHGIANRDRDENRDELEVPEDEERAAAEPATSDVAATTSGRRRSRRVSAYRPGRLSPVSA